MVKGKLGQLFDYFAHINQQQDMKKLVLLFAMVVVASSMNAQTSDDPWWIDINYSNNKFSYRYYESLFDFGDLDNSGFRVGVDRYLNSSLDVEFGTSYGKLSHEDIFEANVFDVDLRLVYKLANGYLLKEESKVAPFVFAGYGVTSFSNIRGFYTQFEDGLRSHMPLGAGLEFKVTEGASIEAMASYKKSIEQAPNYMQYTVGVSFSLGGKRDSDGDGILDKEDACPNVAGPAENKGCPWPDTDGDGVLDKDDQCPTEAGTLNGCPDADGDGIKDSEDACPSVAGIAKFNGCPDTDGDGIQDSEDECPTVAGTLNGCPDRDGDGVKDSEDQCPSVAGTLNGCPDKDKDGVKDSEDQCPETYGLASNGGCPEVQEEVQQVLDLAVKNIQFNSGSDVLRPSSFESLNQVVQLMKENNFNIKLSGYTDNTGNAASNLELSKRRANSVKKYIVDQGIDASRISSDGYGIANPVADNSTREGRAANRRVEIEIIFR